MNIYFSDTFPVDPALQLQWADFMTSLIHGSELGTVSIHLEQPTEIARNCGANALACYSPGTFSIYAPAVDPAIDVSAKGVLIHEYGHHIAASRANPPFESEDYGTKRWATYENVCSRTRAGDLFPGAEDQRFYTLNPGEAYAETYRVLNEQRLNLPLEAWSIVSTSLQPDATALSLLESDVTTPWTADTVTPFTAKLSSKVRAVKFVVQTPLDGTIGVRSHKTGKTEVNVALLVKNKIGEGEDVHVHVVVDLVDGVRRALLLRPGEADGEDHEDDEGDRQPVRLHALDAPRLSAVAARGPRRSRRRARRARTSASRGRRRGSAGR